MTTLPAHPVMIFYGFVRMPFDKDFESSQAFSSSSLTTTVAMLKLGVETEDILLVSGPIGSGKSVALRSFIVALDPNRFSPVYVRGLGISAADLVKSVLLSLLVEPPYTYAKSRTLYSKPSPSSRASQLSSLTMARTCWSLPSCPSRISSISTQIRNPESPLSSADSPSSGRPCAIRGSRRSTKGSDIGWSSPGCPSRIPATTLTTPSRSPGDHRLSSPTMPRPKSTSALSAYRSRSTGFVS